MDTVGESWQMLSPFAGAGGSCTMEQVLPYINNARRMLWDKADNKNTCAYYCIECIDSCVTLPSVIKAVRLAWLGNAPASLANEWYQAIPQIGLTGGGGQGPSGWGASGTWGEVCTAKMILIGGKHTTFREYYARPYYWWLQAESGLDAGVEMTLTGRDEYSTWKKETLTLASPPGYTKSRYSYVATGDIVKPQTAGRVRLYAYDPMLDARLLLAIYQPYDVNPSFIRYKVNGWKDNAMFFAKNKYFPLTQETDLIEFPAQAMIHAVKAYSYLEGSDNVNYQTQLGLAIAEINRDTADDEQIVGSPMRYFGGQEIPSLTANIAGPYVGYGWIR